MQGETTQRILKAANSLIIERGYSAFSYADIAEAVAIRKASIHHHFPTKADLGTAVLKAHRENLMNATAHLDQAIADPLQRLQAYVGYWENCIRTRTMPFCIAALLGAELPSLPDQVQAEVRLYFIALEQWLEKTLQEGLSRNVIKLQESPATEAELLMATIHGAMLSARATGNDTIFQTISTAAIQRIIPPPS